MYAKWKVPGMGGKTQAEPKLNPPPSPLTPLSQTDVHSQIITPPPPPASPPLNSGTYLTGPDLQGLMDGFRKGESLKFEMPVCKNITAMVWIEISRITRGKTLDEWKIEGDDFVCTYNTHTCSGVLEPKFVT